MYFRQGSHLNAGFRRRYMCMCVCSPLSMFYLFPSIPSFSVLHLSSSPLFPSLLCTSVLIACLPLLHSPSLPPSPHHYPSLPSSHSPHPLLIPFYTTFSPPSTYFFTSFRTLAYSHHLPSSPPPLSALPPSSVWFLYRRLSDNVSSWNSQIRTWGNYRRGYVCEWITPSSGEYTHLLTSHPPTTTPCPTSFWCCPSERWSKTSQSRTTHFQDIRSRF